MLDISYGIQTKPENDEFIETADKALRGVEACDNMSIIDLLPWSTYFYSHYHCITFLHLTHRRRSRTLLVQHMPSWIPGMWWKKKVDVIKSQVLRMRDAPYEWITEQLVSRYSLICGLSSVIQHFDPTEKWICEALHCDRPHLQV